MIIYNRYINNSDHTWYNSSNVIYSRCYDNSDQFKTLKVVYHMGRTYLYKNVDVTDYIQFKNAESNGSGIHNFIIKKGYESVRLPDTNLEELEKLKEDFMKADSENGETTFSDLVYHIDYCDEDGKFILYLNRTPIYKGIEGQVSIVNLFKSMNVGFIMEKVDDIDLFKEDQILPTDSISTMEESPSVDSNEQ